MNGSFSNLVVGTVQVVFSSLYPLGRMFFSFVLAFLLRQTLRNLVLVPLGCAVGWKMVWMGMRCRRPTKRTLEERLCDAEMTVANYTNEMNTLKEQIKRMEMNQCEEIHRLDMLITGTIIKGTDDITEEMNANNADLEERYDEQALVLKRHDTEIKDLTERLRGAYILIPGQGSYPLRFVAKPT